MREIKFRVWCKRTKTMQGPGGWFALLQTGQLLSYGPVRPFREEPMEFYDIEQFTGLKDCEGKEIYEGDVVSWRGYEVLNGKQIRSERKCVVGEPTSNWQTIKNVGTLKVIGNIHENPELLEAKP